MNNALYPKLAASNIAKHRKIYFPYIISSAVVCAMLYIMWAIHFDENICKLRGASYLTELINMGIIVIVIFSLIFLIYTNSFLMKQRTKELGLYNILGMEKRHICKIITFETLYSCVFGILAGIVSGIVFHKLVTLILFKIMKMDIQLGFFVSFKSILSSAAVLALIFGINLFFNIIKVYKTNPLDLMNSARTGEKEPKAKIISTALGVLFLGAGYIIAVTVNDPLDALTLFFIAVLCVIAGTYCLFISGSISLLKLLKKNKRYYYNKKHFTSVSGLLYRMKQNAVGLANICILSTMVLVMVSATVSLYAGAEDALKQRYPSDISIEYNGYENQEEISKKITNAVYEASEENGFEILDFSDLKYLSFAAVLKNGDTFETDNTSYSSTFSVQTLCIVTADEYKSLSGENAVLKDNQVIVHSNGTQLGDSFNLFGKRYDIVRKADEFKDISNYSAVLADIHYIVVADESVLNDIDESQLEAYEGNASEINHQITFNLNGTNEEKIQLSETITSSVEKALEGESAHCIIESRSVNRNDFYELYGSLLFLGIVLGSLFLMVTVIIIYYKQISEGYGDRERYVIMQKVGMSDSEVKSSVRSQVLTVFFLPLVTACVHLSFAFPIISKLLMLLQLNNTKIFALGLAATAVIFAVIYTLVYSVTARTYYKIVRK